MRTQGRLGQIPLAAAKLAAIPVVRASGGDHGKDLAHPDAVPVAQREPEHPVLHLVPRFGLHRVVHPSRGCLPREQEQEKKCRRGDGAGGRHRSVHVHEYLAIGTDIREFTRGDRAGQHHRALSTLGIVVLKGVGGFSATWGVRVRGGGPSGS